jgi:hypothetical protein
MTLYLRLAAYALVAALLVAGGWHLGGLAPKKALADLKAQDWQGKAQAAAAALVATQAQLKDLQDTDARNAGIIKDLNDANLKTAADRDRNADLYQRLLHRAALPAPAAGPAMPAAQGGSGAAGPGGASSGDPAPGLLADATAECARNADRLDALSAQVTPQLHLPGAPP